MRRVVSGFAVTALAAAPAVARLPGTPAAASPPVVVAPALLPFAPLAAAAARFRGKDGGSQVLKFSERRDRLKRKSGDEREELERLQEELVTFANEEYPQDLDALFERHFAKAQAAKMRLFNPVAAVEQVKVAVPPHPPRPMPQLGSIVRPSLRELHVVPHQAASANSIVQTLCKQLPELAAGKDVKTGRVVCRLQPVTGERRAITAEDVEDCRRAYDKELRTVRQKAMEHIDRAGLKDLNFTRQRHAEVEAHTKEQHELRDAEFEEFKRSVFDDVVADEEQEDDAPASAPEPPK